MKRLLLLLLALTLCATALLACNEEKETDDSTVRLGVMRGPTGIGAVKLMEDNKDSTLYDFKVENDASFLSPLLIRGELDAATVPANIAATLYNNSNGEIRIAAINTLGVLSILEKGNAVQNLADLKGKTIYAPASAKGSVPEFTLRYLLTESGVDPDEDVFFEWKSQEEILVYLKNNEGGIAMLPQPAATAALTQVSGLRTAVDLNAAWEALDTDALSITGVLVVRNDFVKKHPDAYRRLLQDYEASINYAKENVDAVAPLVEAHLTTIKAAIAKKAIPHCNLTYMDGAEMKTVVSGFLTVLYEQNPASVGGKLPDDNFYLNVKGK